MNHQSQAWDNYWRGRKGDGASALAGIEHDEELATFWDGALGPLPKDRPLLDLACGAGTVLRHAARLGFSRLTGADYSPAAIDALKAAVPDADGIICSADETPFSDAAYTTVVSQFGLEYADRLAAAAEVSRLLVPNGQFVALCHLEGGAIHAEVKAHHADCRTLDESGYIPQSKALFTAVFAGDAAAMQQAQEIMAPAREAVAALIIPGRQSLAAHLTSGTAQLWDNRAKYALGDILGWLDGMEQQRAAFEARMTSMMAATLSESDARAILDELARGGCEAQPLERLQLGGEDAAWVLRARKSV